PTCWPRRPCRYGPHGSNALGANPGNSKRIGGESAGRQERATRSAAIIPGEPRMIAAGSADQSVSQRDAGGVGRQDDFYPAVELAAGGAGIVSAGLVVGHGAQAHALTLDATQAQDAGDRLGPLHAQLLVQLLGAVAVAEADPGPLSGASDLQCLGNLAQRRQARRQQQGALGIETAIHWDHQADLLAFALDLITLLFGNAGEIDDT